MGGWDFEILSSVDIVETRARLTWGLCGPFTRIAMNVPRYIMYCRLAVVFAWGERTAAPRSLTLLLHAALNLHGPGPYLSLPSKTVAATVDKQEWEVGTNLPLRGQGQLSSCSVL